MTHADQRVSKLVALQASKISSPSRCSIEIPQDYVAVYKLLNQAAEIHYALMHSPPDKFEKIKNELTLAHYQEELEKFQREAARKAVAL